jgi:hypothetical protein
VLFFQTGLSDFKQGKAAENAVCKTVQAGKYVISMPFY